MLVQMTGAKVGKIREGQVEKVGVKGSGSRMSNGKRGEGKWDGIKGDKIGQMRGEWVVRVARGNEEWEQRNLWKMRGGEVGEMTEDEVGEVKGQEEW